MNDDYMDPAIKRIIKPDTRKSERSLFKVTYSTGKYMFLWSTHSNIIKDLSKIYRELGYSDHSTIYKYIEIICEERYIVDTEKNNKY